MTPRLALKGNALLEKSGVKNVHQVVLRARISTQTGYRYIDNAKDMKELDLKVLSALLIDGAGMTPEQVLGMKIGDLFEFLEENKTTT